MACACLYSLNILLIPVVSTDDLPVPHNGKNGVLFIALTSVLATAAVVAVGMYRRRRKGESARGARGS